MKDLFLKKIIPIISVVVVIVSLFCFNTSAVTSLSEIPQDLSWVNLTPGSAFAWFDCADDYLHKETDTQANAQFNENDLVYYFDFSRSSVTMQNQITNIFFNINIAGNGYELKPNINYYFRMKVIIPTAYGPNESSGFQWRTGRFYAGGYSWASVAYADRGYYNFQMSSPQMTNVDYTYPENKFPLYPYKVNGSTVNLSYIDVVGTVTRSSSMNLKSIGFELPIDNAWGWHGWLGVGGFQIGLPSQYAPLPGGTPNYDSGNSNDMHDLENNINNQNQANINAGNQLFNNFGNLLTSDSRLVKGITASTFIFNRLFGNIPWVNNLLTFSLTLGLVAFLLGSGVAIYNAGHNKNVRSQRRAENEKRQAQMRAARAARAKKSKGG